MGNGGDGKCVELYIIINSESAQCERDHVFAFRMVSAWTQLAQLLSKVEADVTRTFQTTSDIGNACFGMAIVHLAHRSLSPFPVMMA